MLLILAWTIFPSLLFADSPLAGPWHGMKTYQGRIDLGEFHLDVEFSSAGNPLLMGQEITAVGEAFVQPMDSEYRVIEVTELEVKPNRVTLGYTIAGVQRLASGKLADTGVRLHTRRLQFALAGDTIVLNETDLTPEGSRLEAKAVLQRGLHRSLLAGPWVGFTETDRGKVRFSYRGFPIINGTEVTQLGQTVGSAKVVGLNVQPRKVELSLEKDGTKQATAWVVDDWMRLQETGDRNRVYTRQYRLAGQWEGSTIDKDGKTIAKQVFAFDHDGIPILNGERRTTPGTTFRTVPGIKDASGVGMETHILRSLRTSPEQVYYQVRYETWIKVDTLLSDHDHYFTPRPDSDDVVDFRVENRGKLLHQGTLKRIAAAPEIPQAKLPRMAKLPNLELPTALRKTTPVKLVDPSPWTGTWLGKVTMNDQSTREDYFEFSPVGRPLFGYREIGDLRQTTVLEKAGQKFNFEIRRRNVTVNVKQLTSGGNRIAYTVDRVEHLAIEKVGKIQDTTAISRSFNLKQNSISFEERVTPPKKPVVTAKGTLERLRPFGGYWEGKTQNSRAGTPWADSTRIVDGGRAVFYQSHGPGSSQHQVELTHVGQEIIGRLPNGGLFRTEVLELDATPFRTAYVVEITRGSLDPTKAPEKEYTLNITQRTGQSVQMFVRVSRDRKFSNDQPYNLGVFEPR